MIDESSGKGAPVPVPGQIPKFNFTYTQEGSNDSSSKELEPNGLYPGYHPVPPYHPSMTIPLNPYSQQIVTGYHSMMQSPPSSLMHDHNKSVMGPNYSSKKNRNRVVKK